MQADRVIAEHRRHVDSLERPEEVQREVLAEILKENGHTEYGRAHDMPAVATVDDYRRSVPIRTHQELMPWIDRVIGGESDVLTAEEPQVYFSSSGSTGREKQIPVTRAYMQRVFLPFYHASFAVLMRELPEALGVPGSVLNLWQDPTAPIARTRGGQPHIGPSQVDYRKFGEESAVGPGNDAAWSRIPEALAGHDPWERSYYKLRLAAEQDIRLLIGINPAMVAGLPFQLREHWTRLVDEMRAGTVGGLAHGTPNPRRADELAAAADRFGAVHPYLLWPRMAGIVAWNSALASLYLPRVRETFGPGVRLFAAPIASCEGPAAVPVDLHPSGAPLYVRGCFYEFAPAERPLTADTETLLAHELDEGRDYHLILSHLGGMYRCAVTDVVRVVGHVARTPRVEYAGRAISRDGLTEAVAVRALRAAAADTGAELRNATYRPGADGFQVAVTGLIPDGFPAALRARLGRPVEVLRAHPDAFLREWARTVRSGQRPPRVKDRVFLPSDEAWARIVGETR
ncbi:GH3 family domain-containing protein [Mangrovihabitans endophyticus]|uniref:GH3 middle domain-containing protein n=1 Tax=Mangrovihabitans endophyticus TaxID=1751298 RepID=A0A8J3FSJ3_9ACTN|nr:GH3 auxin-responsive promoter family protein [Mangrovihabitans endophyticus]GGL19837.1 hypothetical protein GCM10012284_63050 [Mangrovihabitans endophyticus]